MRADRLVSALLLMQARGRVTAAELADELEVSVATARRDLEALSAAGIPVYPQPGRGGGWALVGGARTDLSGLSAMEAQALFLLLGPVAAVSSEAKTALRKLVRALPQTFRADAEAAANAVIIDSTRWGERDRDRPAMVDLLQTAVVHRRKVRLTYANNAREQSERVVDPWGLVDKDDVWYLLAGTEHGQRTFRVDRIIAAQPTGQPGERPDDFTLATAWNQVVDEMEQRRSRTWATVLIESRFVPVLRDQFGRHCHLDGELADGRTRVRLAAPTPLDIARHLAGWGEMIEVIEPASIQHELARIGTELTERYAAEMSFDADPRVDAYIEALPAWQQAICQEVRELVHAVDPEVTETIKRSVQPYFVLDGNICALLAAKDHVNVFLYDGAIVPDPDGIITAGHDNKTARTVAVKQGETLPAAPLSEMFRQIIANNRAGGWRKLKS